MEAERPSERAASNHSYRKAHFYAALIQVLLAALSIAESFRFSYWDEMLGPGAGFVPRWLGIFWLPIASALLWQSRRAMPPEEGHTVMPEGRERRRLGLFILILTGLMLGFVPLGAIISVAAFVAISLKLFEEYTWRHAALTGTVMSGLLYLLFRTWLNVPLPRGILFFL